MSAYSIETLQEITPSVFASGPSPKLTNRYTFVPTDKILENFDREGWKVYSAKQMGKGQYSKHELRLGNMPMVGDTFLEALIRNSHDGTTMFSVSAGLHRLVCSNGLTVPTSVSDSIRVRHMNFDLGTVRMITDQFAERLPVIEGSVNKMMQVSMNDSQKIDFVGKAKLIRWDKGVIPALSVENILTPNRQEDSDNSVWSVFNIVQEKFVRGGTQYKTTKGRLTSMKYLKDFQSINKINTQLWELAESYC
jgi:hypothetical protein